MLEPGKPSRHFPPSLALPLDVIGKATLPALFGSPRWDFWGASRSSSHRRTRSIFPASASVALSVCRAPGKTIAGDSGFNGH